MRPIYLIATFLLDKKQMISEGNDILFSYDIFLRIETYPAYLTTNDSTEIKKLIFPLLSENHCDWNNEE